MPESSRCLRARKSVWMCARLACAQPEVGQHRIADVQGTQLPQHFPAVRTSQAKSGIDTGDIDGFGRNWT